MQQLSFYYSTNTPLEKTTCLLAEKSYKNNFRIVILTPNVEIQESLNKILWTYSQKEFLPHGSNLDPLPAAQPIYITNILEIPNKATLLIIVNPPNIIEVLNNNPYISQFQRIIVAYDLFDEAILHKITDWITQRENKNTIIDFYKQSPNNAWLAVK
jgi:DNA polymerase-3 subunit chi